MVQRLRIKLYGPEAEVARGLWAERLAQLRPLFGERPDGALSVTIGSTSESYEASAVLVLGPTTHTAHVEAPVLEEALEGLAHKLAAQLRAHAAGSGAPRVHLPVGAVTATLRPAPSPAGPVTADLISPDDDPEAEAAIAEDVLRALEDLPASARRSFWAFAVEGASPEDIARDQGRPLSAVHADLDAAEAALARGLPGAPESVPEPHGAS